MKTNQLPIIRNLSLAYTLSVIVALLIALTSLAGLLFPSAVYLTRELRHSFLSNDVVNLLIGLPILLGSMALTRRGRLLGLLFWPGALFYITYNSIAYVVAMPFTWPFLFHLALVSLSVATMFSLLSSMDSAATQQRLKGTVPERERLVAGVLVGLGSLFFLRGIGQVTSALTGQTELAVPELAVLVADLLTTPMWILGGVMLWRRQAFGYVVGAGLLFQASMLFIGLLVFFILQPAVAGVPFPMGDFVVIFVIGLVCFVPFGQFVRGALSIRQGNP